MHRVFVLPLVLLLMITAVMAAAQDNPEPIPVTPPPDTSVTYEELMALDLPSFDSVAGPFAIQAEAGSDFCSTATTINLSAGADGSVMDVTPMTVSADDPVLTCMWGSPSSNQGYRTVWYQFTPQYNGIVTVSTRPGGASAISYDTVVAVHTGACGLLQTVACNDDKIGFTSEVTFNVKRGITYYIEVASWSPAGNSPQILNLTVQINPFNTFWQVAGALTGGGGTPSSRSRHASVMLGSDMYVMGGRDGNGTQLNDTWKLNTTTGTWTQLAVFPPGLLNTTAVYLNDTASITPTRRIYVPGGSLDAGGQNSSLQHWYYDLDLQNWYLAPEFVGGGFITETATLTQTFAYAAAVANASTTDPRYYVTGGVVGQGFPLTTTATVLNQVLIYKPNLPSHLRWGVAQPMISPRYGHTAARVGDRICVTGGLNINQVTGEIVLIPNGECASAVSGTGWLATGNMNVARYFAHSAVSPNGKWYVYGGVDAKGLAVAEVEVYDPATKQWSVLPLPYDLGGQGRTLLDGVAVPVWSGGGLVWPRGGFVGNHLWSMGGSYNFIGSSAEPRLFKVQMLGLDSYLPVMFNNTGGLGNNHSLATAYPLPLNVTLSQNFTQNIFHNTYYFDLAQMKTVNVALTNVPDGYWFNLFVYDANKLLRGIANNPPWGNKSVNLPNLPPGRYFVLVQQTLPANVNPAVYYQIRVNG